MDTRYKWSKEDLDFIEANWKIKTLDELAAHFEVEPHTLRNVTYQYPDRFPPKLAPKIHNAIELTDDQVQFVRENIYSGKRYIARGLSITKNQLDSWLLRRRKQYNIPLADRDIPVGARRTVLTSWQTEITSVWDGVRWIRQNAEIVTAEPVATPIQKKAEVCHTPDSKGRIYFMPNPKTRVYCFPEKLESTLKKWGLAC